MGVIVDVERFGKVRECFSAWFGVVFWWDKFMA